MIAEVLIVLSSLVLSILCSGSETAYSAASRIRAAASAETGKPLARLAFWFIDDPSRYLTTTLVGNNVANVLASSIASGWVAGRAPLFTTLQVVLTTLFLLIFCEILPKQNALLRADSMLQPLSPALMLMRIVFYPLIVSAGAVAGLLSGRPSMNRFFESRAEVRSLLENSGGTEGRKAWDAIEMGATSIRLHSRPLSDFPRVTLGISRQQAIQRIIESGSDFLLVVEGEVRALSGILESRAVLKSVGSWNPGRMLTGIPAFPKDSVPLKVLLDMWRSGAGAAVVLDETGQPGGIVTQGDLLDTLLAVERP